MKKLQTLLGILGLFSLGAMAQAVITPFGVEFSNGSQPVRLTEVCAPVTHATLRTSEDALAALKKIKDSALDKDAETAVLVSMSRGFYLDRIFLDIPSEFKYTMQRRGHANQAITSYYPLANPRLKEFVFNLLVYKASGRNACVVNALPAGDITKLDLNLNSNLYAQE